MEEEDVKPASPQLCPTGETMEERVASQLLTYWPPILIVIATLGNIFAALILWKLIPKVLSTCLYIFVILIVDLTSVYLRAGNDWLVHMVGVDVRRRAQLTSNSVCKIYPFVTDWSYHFSVWLTVAMAIETSIVTMRPHNLMKVCRVERARAVILLLIVLIVCLDAHNFWTFSLVADERGGHIEYQCTNARQGNQLSTVFRKTAWPILDIFLGDLLPLCITLSCSVMMITRRVRLPDQVRQLETTWKAYSVDNATARHLQICFIIISSGHFFLMLPKLGYDIFALLVDPALELVAFSCKIHSQRALAEAVASIALYTFLSCKIFIFLCVSPAVRERFCALMLCTSCSRETVSAQPSVSTQQPLLTTVSDKYPANYPRDNGLPHTRIVYTSTSV